MAGLVQHPGLLTPRVVLQGQMQTFCWNSLFLKSALAESPKSEITPCGSGKLRLEKEALAPVFMSGQVYWDSPCFLL